MASSNRMTPPATVQAKNRRRRYLQLHPEYFEAENGLELVDPLLYDRLVRTFQSQAQLSAEKQRLGYAHTLENDLWRAEARRAEAVERRENENHSASVHALERMDLGRDSRPSVVDVANGGAPMRAEPHSNDGRESSPPPDSAEAGLAQWREIMGARFVAGEDVEFQSEGGERSYAAIDVDEGLDDDVEEQRDRADHYFDDEEEAFVLEQDGKGPQGETGVLDY